MDTDDDTRYYYLKDHLGSVRVTLKDNGTAAGADDFYPFGLQMPGRYYNQSNEFDDRKFTGHFLEQEGGLGIYHAGARLYDPEVPRFYGVDAMRGLYPGWSSYVYALNNPVLLIDITGNSAECVHRDDDGYCTEYVRDEIIVTADRETGEGRHRSETFSFNLCPFTGKSTTSRSEFSLSNISFNQVSHSQSLPTTYDTEDLETSFLDCLADCIADQLGLHSIAGAVGVISGQPMLRTRGKFSGNVRGTSPASRAASSIFDDAKSPVRLPSVTGGPGTGQAMRITATTSIARFAGRAVPVVGWAIMGYDAVSIGLCVNDCLSN